MRILIPLLRLVVLAGLLLASSAPANDVDGPDCGRAIRDLGDAPEGIGIGFLGRIGHFPTCLAPSAPGTQELVCPPRGTPPGPTGFVQHVQLGQANYWLGCDDTPLGLQGIDGEPDGKVSDGPAASACSSALVTDCGLVAHPGTFGQDECRSDGDAGVFSDFLVPCDGNAITFSTANCGAPRTVFLNVLVDMNFDGDWNDNVPCFDPRFVYCLRACDAGEPCAHEWAVKNAPVLLPAGCAQQQSPGFRVGVEEGSAWMRVSLTDEPVDDDYPWAGSAHRPGGAYAGGETEDYLVSIIAPLPVRSATWGELKLRYR